MHFCFFSVRTSSNGKVAEIVCYIYIFHLTWPTSLLRITHNIMTMYCPLGLTVGVCAIEKTSANANTLLNADVLSFYLLLDLLQSDCSDLVSEWRAHTTFLLRGHCQTCAGCPRMSFFAFQQDGTPANREHNIVAFLERDRDARDLSSSKRLCLYMRCTFRTQILTILSWSVMTTKLN